MRVPVRFELDMGDVEVQVEGEAVFDAANVLGVLQYRAFDHDKGAMFTCQKRCRLMLHDTSVHAHPIVVGSLSEVAEKIASAMRGGSASVLGTDMLPYRGGR